MKKYFLKNYKNERIYNNNNTLVLLLKILKIYRKKKIFFLNFPIQNILRKNFCIETGLKRSVFRDFSLSRMNIKESLNMKQINGLKKISW